MQTRLITALNAVKATTTSEEINVKYAKKIVLLLKRADNSEGGSSAFTVEGSVDNGVSYQTLSILRDNATGINTLVAGKTLSSDTSALVAIDLESGFALDLIKVTVTETTGGTHTAKVYITE